MQINTYIRVYPTNAWSQGKKFKHSLYQPRQQVVYFPFLFISFSLCRYFAFHLLLQQRHFGKSIFINPLPQYSIHTSTFTYLFCICFGILFLLLWSFTHSPFFYTELKLIHVLTSVAANLYCSLAGRQWGLEMLLALVHMIMYVCLYVRMFLLVFESLFYSFTTNNSCRFIGVTYLIAFTVISFRAHNHPLRRRPRHSNLFGEICV